MKQLNLIVLILILSVTGIFAQADGKSQDDRMDRMKAQHTAYLTSKLQLTSAESEKFWPIYNEYRGKVKALRTDGRDGRPTTPVSEADAEKALNAGLEREQKVLDLKKQYYKEFRKAIPASKIARLDRAEREFKKELIDRMGNKKPVRKQNR